MISKRSVEDVMEAVRLEVVVQDAGVNLKKKGKDFVGNCPACGALDKFSVSPVKNIYKCWVCDLTGKGPINFLIDKNKITFVEAVEHLAKDYNVTLQYDEKLKRQKASKIVAPVADQAPALLEEKKKKSRKQDAKPSFRDEQMKASGLEEADQRCIIRIDDKTEKEMDRYQAGSIDSQWNIIPGDDMVMHYVDLYGKQVMYTPPKRNKAVPMIRMRWQNPSLHLDKNGSPIKYQSPYKSGSHLWIPNVVRNKFHQRIQFDTLYIHEGEKKADKCTKHGMMSVGIMGIHNIAYNNDMPYEFQLIIKTCGVKNVVFVVDSDWNDLSEKLDKPVDLRPKTFLSAVCNFKDYFYAFSNNNIYLEIFFAHIKENDFKAKGADDLLNALPELEKDLMLADFKKTMVEKTGQGKYINCYKITGYTHSKLREIFHLHNNEAFANHHLAKLKERIIFTIGNLKWKIDENDKLVLAQDLMPDETFWKEETFIDAKGKEHFKLKFHYGNCYNFLKNRRFGRFQMAEKFKFIKIDDKIVREIEPFAIKDYVVEFTEAINKQEVLELLYRGAKMYIGPDSLSNLKYINPVFHRSEKGIQYLYFQKHYWKITREGIEEKNLSELDAYIWDNKIIDFDSKKACNDFIKIRKITDEVISEMEPAEILRFGKFKGSYDLDLSDEAKESHFVEFLINCSNFYHDKEKPSDDELFETNLHMVSKMTAIGYLLHSYRDSNVLKAVVAMDGKLSEVGSSNGRSGKSLIGEAISKVVPTVYVPGKRKDLTEDKFIWEEVDERTNVLFLDDVRVNVDFEFFFPIITGKMQIEGKGMKKFSLPADRTPKLLITTNHALNGDGASFRDRQAQLAFSDYYNETRRPVDDFKVLFFDEWNYDQWNLFYNFMACCLKTYFEFGIVSPPTERLEQRRLRQQIGESFLDWAELFYDEMGPNIGNKIPRKELMDKFFEDDPKQKTFIKPRDFKKKLMLYCRYKKLLFNPGKDAEGKQWGGDDKSHGIEYFTVARMPK